MESTEAPAQAGLLETSGVMPTVVSVPLGQRVAVASDLLLAAPSTPSTRALAADLARILDTWSGPGTVIVAGNLFAPPQSNDRALGIDDVSAALDAHPELSRALSTFAERPDSRLFLQSGWRDPELDADPAIRDHLTGRGLTLVDALQLDLTTSAGVRTVHVRPGYPPETTREIPPTNERPWLAGADRLDHPDAVDQFVRSRTLYRRLGRYLWIPPLVAFLLALVVRMTFFFNGACRILRRHGHHCVLTRVHTASWSTRLLVTLGIIVVAEAILALVLAVITRRFWSSHSPPEISDDFEDHVHAGAADDTGLFVDFAGIRVPALDAARLFVSEGAAGLVTSGSLRGALTHLSQGFLAVPGSMSDLVREHRGRFGLPPVFLAHRQISWTELETGADLHVRLLADDADLPGSTMLERVATGYPVIKGYKAAPDLHPTLAASWPHGSSWPPGPDLAATRAHVRRVRRMAAAAIFTAGLVDLLASVARPFSSHLDFVRQVLPIGLIQAAGALVALSGIALLMLARSVLRGQRRAWSVAVFLLAGTVVLHLAHASGFAGVIISALVLALLLVERDLFSARADATSTRSALLTLVFGGVLAVGLATAVVEIGSGIGHYHRTVPPFLTVLLGTTERLAGFQSIDLPTATDRWISPSLLAVGLSLVVVTLYLVTRPVVDRRLTLRESSPGRSSPVRQAEELRARDIVHRHGVGSLDYFALRDDKEWFFHRDSLVAYAVYGGVALASPDPIGPVSERRLVWDAFRSHCDQQGWGVAVLGAAEEWLPIYRDAGMRHIYLGDEAIVDVQTFSLAGKKMKGLRQAVSRIANYGYTVEFVDPSTVSPELATTLLDLMGRHRRGGHERGFSMMLGRILDRRDVGLMITLVRDPEGTPVAMCQFVPSAAIRGFSLDLMRRDPGTHPNGLLDFALCSTIDHLRSQGQQGLSLNFAALRSALEGEAGDSLGHRLERWILKRLSSIFQIESLWKFNAKYEPSWLPRYVVFDSAERFAPAVITILRAEALSDVPLIGRLFVPRGARAGTAPSPPT